LEYIVENAKVTQRTRRVTGTNFYIQNQKGEKQVTQRRQSHFFLFSLKNCKHLVSKSGHSILKREHLPFLLPLASFAPLRSLRENLPENRTKGTGEWPSSIAHFP